MCCAIKYVFVRNPKLHKVVAATHGMGASSINPKMIKRTVNKIHCFANNKNIIWAIRRSDWLGTALLLSTLYDSIKKPIVCATAEKYRLKLPSHHPSIDLSIHPSLHGLGLRCDECVNSMHIRTVCTETRTQKQWILALKLHRFVLVSNGCTWITYFKRVSSSPLFTLQFMQFRLVFCLYCKMRVSDFLSLSLSSPSPPTPPRVDYVVVFCLLSTVTSAASAQRLLATSTILKLDDV